MGKAHIRKVTDGRVTIPTAEGDRDVPTYGTLMGWDADNVGHVLVHTDGPVMGERVHSVSAEDVEQVHARGTTTQ